MVPDLKKWAGLSDHEVGGEIGLQAAAGLSPNWHDETEGIRMSLKHAWLSRVRQELDSVLQVCRFQRFGDQFKITNCLANRDLHLMSVNHSGE